MTIPCGHDTSLSYNVSHPLYSPLTTCDMTSRTNMFSFSSEEGVALVHQLLQDPWSHKLHDHQLKAVTKALDGTDVLVLLPTGVGKTAILTMFMLILNHLKRNLDEFPQHSA